MPPKSQPRGIRNHNPGNIRRSKDPWQGLAAQQTDKDFLTFEAPKWGIRALARTLITYQDRHGLNTVRGIISRWAPPNENNTLAYVRAVAAAVGVGPDDVIDLQHYEILRPMVVAIIKHENGMQPYSAAQIDAGLVLAGVVGKPKPIAKTTEVRAGTVAAGAAGAGVVAEAVRQAEPALPFLHLLTDMAPWIVALVVLGVAGWIIWSRIEDRRKGLR